MEPKKDIDFQKQIFGGYSIEEVECFISKQRTEKQEYRSTIEALESKVRQQQRTIEEKNRTIDTLQRIKGSAERSLLYQQLQKA